MKTKVKILKKNKMGKSRIGSKILIIPKVIAHKEVKLYKIICENILIFNLNVLLQ